MPPPAVWGSPRFRSHATLAPRCWQPLAARESGRFLKKFGVAAALTSSTRPSSRGSAPTRPVGGVDVVLNSLSGDLMEASLACVAPFGRFIELGVRDIYAGASLNLRRFANGLSFTSLNVGPGMPGFSDVFREVLELVQSGALAPLPHEVFSISASSRAFEHMARARHIGKVVLQLRPGADLRAGSGTEARSPGLTCSEGAELFRFALSLGEPRIVVSVRDLDKLLAPNSAAGAGEVDAGRGGLAARPLLSTPYAEAKGDAERGMAALLAQLLGFDRIGRGDDFFELGGELLLGTQFISRVNRDLGSRLTLQDLFEQPCIAALAARLDTATPRKGCGACCLSLETRRLRASRTRNARRPMRGTLNSIASWGRSSNRGGD